MLVPLFHSIAELFNIVVACGIFVLIWNSRRYMESAYFFLLGTGHLFASIIDLLHVLSYAGISVYAGSEINPSVHFWIIGRYLQSVSYLAAIFFAAKKIKERTVFLSYALLTLLLLFFLLPGKVLAVDYASEYLITAIFCAAAFITLKNPELFTKGVLRKLVLSAVSSAASEFLIIWHGNAQGTFSVSAHLLRVAASCFLYLAVTETGLGRPYNLIFNTLKNTTERLLREKEKLQAYLDVAGVIIVIIDTEMRVSLINKKGCELLGLSQDKIIGRNWFDNFVPERMREEVKDTFRELITGHIKPAEYFENPIVTKDAKERLIAWHNAILMDNSGKIISTISSGEDITERRAAEEALRQAHDELELEAFFNHTITPMVFLSRDFDFMRVNKAYANVCQRDAAYFPGKNYFELYPDKEVQDMFIRALKTKAPHQVFARSFVSPDHPEWGTTYWDWTLVPILDASQGVGFLVLSLQDVTASADRKGMTTRHKNFADI